MWIWHVGIRAVEALTFQPTIMKCLAGLKNSWATQALILYIYQIQLYYKL